MTRAENSCTQSSKINLRSLSHARNDSIEIVTDNAHCASYELKVTWAFFDRKDSFDEGKNKDEGVGLQEPHTDTNHHRCCYCRFETTIVVVHLLAIRRSHPNLLSKETALCTIVVAVFHKVISSKNTNITTKIWINSCAFVSLFY